jgi:hypothetical protein
LLAVWGIDLLVSFGPENIPRLKEVGIDSRVLGFTLSLSLLTGAVFGLAPALRPSRIDFTEALKEGGRTSPGGPGRHRLGRLLVISEMALAMVLLVGAGLLVQSFVRLQQVNPGFDATHGLTMQINLPQSKHPKQRAAFLQQALERIETLPGVKVAGAAHRLPLRGNSGIGFLIEGRPALPPGQEISINYRSITPGYFQALGMRSSEGERSLSKKRGVQAEQSSSTRQWRAVIGPMKIPSVSESSWDARTPAHSHRRGRGRT